MTMHKALHDRLYMSRKGGRGHTSIDESIQGLKEYVNKSKDKLIIVARNSTEHNDQQNNN